MSDKITIEFFHDIICSFCFPMSKNMRDFAERNPDVEIKHRSFALAWEDQDYTFHYGSREAVKEQVVPHWAKANDLDPERRFNIEGMLQSDFNFPLSKNALIAAKAAGVMAGEDAYWDVFDALQKKLFVENKNIEDDCVLEEAVLDAGLDVDAWRDYYKSSEVKDLVLQDLKLVRASGITSVPSLIVNDQYLIPGVMSAENLEAIIEKIKVEYVK